MKLGRGDHAISIMADVNFMLRIGVGIWSIRSFSSVSSVFETFGFWKEKTEVLKRIIGTEPK
jgi:hypothetical protein